MQFQALLGGKVVSYPMTATFRVDHRKPGHKYEQGSQYPTIHSALSSFARVEKHGLRARLVSIYKGVEKVIYKTGR